MTKCRHWAEILVQNQFMSKNHCDQRIRSWTLGKFDLSFCLELNFDMQICMIDELQKTGGSKVVDSILNETQDQQSCPLQIHFYMNRTSNNILLCHCNWCLVEKNVCEETQVLTRHT